MELYFTKDHPFYLTSGKALYSLNDLLLSLKGMPDEEFAHHVGKKHNHFADWVDGVFSEKDLTRKIRKAKKRKDLQKILQKFFKEKEKEEQKRKKELLKKTHKIRGPESKEQFLEEMKKNYGA